MKKKAAPKKQPEKKEPEKREPEKRKSFERTYRGGCHCGRIRFEVRGALDRVSECNCSICTKKAYVHWIVPRSAFRLLTKSDDIASYAFSTKTARHLFCPNCGVAPFYIPRSDPDAFDVNVRCLDGVNLNKLEREFFDGRNWEQAIGPYRQERARAAKWDRTNADAGIFAARFRGVRDRRLQRSSGEDLRVHQAPLDPPE